MSFDNMRTLLLQKQTIFLTSDPAFEKSMWEEVCDFTSTNFHRMTVATCCGDQSKYTRAITTIDEYRINSNAPSFIRAALSYSASFDVDIIAAKHVSALIFPSQEVLDMFKNEEEFFSTQTYRNYICKLILLLITFFMFILADIV